MGHHHAHGVSSDFVVAIATTGRSQLLGRTLSSLSQCARPETFRSIIVVENGPKGEAERIAGSFCSSLPVLYQYVDSANKSNALNQALEALSDGLIFFTDDDVRLHPNTLIAYAQAAQGNTAGQFYGGPLLADYEEIPPVWLMEFLPNSVKGWAIDDSNPELADKPLVFLGANWAAFANDIKEAGGFDPSFGPGSPLNRRGQEKEMQSRLRRRGATSVYVPDALVWHYVPRERCTTQWAIERISQTQWAKGAIDRQPGPRVFGYPCRLLPGVMRRTLELLAGSLHPSPRTRFAVRYRYLARLGYLRGSRNVPPRC